MELFAIADTDSKATEQPVVAITASVVLGAPCARGTPVVRARPCLSDQVHVPVSLGGIPIRVPPGLNCFENRFSLSQIHIEPFIDVDLVYAAPGPSDADVGFIEFPA